MLRSYFIIAVRTLLRQKIISIINILGLAIGISCSTLILSWVEDELSFDHFHKNLQSLYRVTANGGDVQVATSMAGMGNAFESELPEVEKSARIIPASHLVEFENLKFEEKGIFYADPSFFEMFSFHFLEGQPTQVLADPNGIVVSEAAARKYFSDGELIGKVLRIDNKHFFTIKGVITNVPANSHLQFDFIFPISFLSKTDYDLKINQWENFRFYTYLQFKTNSIPSASILKEMEDRINQIYRSHTDESADQIRLGLQPVKDIHLHSKFMMDVAGHGNFQNVRSLTISAFIILVIACINFMNLSTARASQRALEVGVRKVVGGTRLNLIIQFMGESLLVSAISLIIGLILLSVFLPMFNEISEKQIKLSLLNPTLGFTILSVSLITGLVAGSYPALFMSRFDTVSVLKGNYKSSKGNIYFRNSLVVIQFGISMVLLIGTTVVYYQLQYIQNKNLGFDKENLIYVPLTGNLLNRQVSLKDELERSHLTEEYTVTDALPSNLASGTSSIQWSGKNPASNPIVSNISIDTRFVNVFKMNIISGRGFSQSFIADSANYVVNEELIHLMNLDSAEAIGKSITLWDKKGEIIGVVKNFHFKSLQQPIEPLILPHLNRPGAYAIIKAQPGLIKATIDKLEDICKKINPEYPFTFDFLDQDLARLYQNERRMSSILKIFAVLAILVSCLGLYGLSAFTTEQSRKEVGIRKILGASPLNIVYILSRKFMALLFVSILISVPISWMIMDSWLQSFSYHISIALSILFMACLVCMVVAGITISHESIKAALANPVKSLRNE
jgi:putative ABC transport system permease protein